MTIAEEIIAQNYLVSNLCKFFFHEFADNTSQSDRTAIAEF